MNLINTLKNKTQEVYDSGYNKGYKDGEQSGKQSLEVFWDFIQDNGNRTDYDCAFGGSFWNPENFKPKYKIKPNKANNMFTTSKNLTMDISKYVDFTDITSIGNCFNGSAITKVGRVDFAKNGVNANLAFIHAKKLKTIEKIIVSGNTGYTQAFDNCESLEDVTFEGIIGADISFKSSPKLTAESIISVVEHLSDTASGKTVTFNQKAIDNADWKTTEYASWDELKATKTNWGFAYA